MIEWHHRLNIGMQAPGGDEGQRNPARYCPWGRSRTRLSLWTPIILIPPLEMTLLYVSVVLGVLFACFLTGVWSRRKRKKDTTVWYYIKSLLKDNVSHAYNGDYVSTLQTRVPSGAGKAVCVYHYLKLPSSFVTAKRSGKQTHSEGQPGSWSAVYYLAVPGRVSSLAKDPYRLGEDLLYKVYVPKPTSPNSLKSTLDNVSKRYNRVRAINLHSKAIWT